MRRLKIAVIGAGRLGSVHARILSKLAGARLMGVVDPCETARQTVAEQCRTNAFADVRQLIDVIDAAVVATPTRFHHQVGMELLGHGKSLLIEKPLAATSAESEALVVAAREHGVVLQVGHVERFNPALKPALEIADDVKYIEATRAGAFTCRSTDVGAVMDLMIHDIDIALSLARSPLRHVEALGVSVFGGHEDVANARLTFESGCVATLNASRASYENTRKMSIWSAAGFANVDFGSRRASVVRPSRALFAREFDVESLSPEEKQAFKDRLFEDYLHKEDFEPSGCDQITAELEDFVRSVREGGRPRVTGEQGRDAVRAAESILHGIETHRWDNSAEGRVRSLRPPATLCRAKSPLGQHARHHSPAPRASGVVRIAHPLWVHSTCWPISRFRAVLHTRREPWLVLCDTLILG